MTVNVDVFSPFMEDGVLSNMHGGGVIIEEKRRSRRSEVQIAKEVGDPVEFTGGGGHSSVFSLGGRPGDSTLFLGMPRHNGGSKEDDIVGNGLAGDGTSSPVGVQKGLKSEIVACRKEETQVDGPFEALFGYGEFKTQEEMQSTKIFDAERGVEMLFSKGDGRKVISDKDDIIDVDEQDGCVRAPN
ncbi:uncharacterized protein [Euphorbia lathyris]|uniref:uncharacterized protein n=1 Tax=Euphorbia lathyris TaxID=212925 RepID=UPI003313A08C